MEAVNKIKAKFNEFFSKNNRKTYIILITGLIGIFLVFLSEVIPSEKTADEKNVMQNKSDFFTMEEGLEIRLEKMISNIYGAGKTEVMLTFESSKEYFYAYDNSEDTDETKNSTENQIVIIDGKNGEEPVTVKIREAKIRGVFIVCEGGSNPVVREKIIEAVCALLDISSNRVSVAKLA